MLNNSLPFGRGNGDRLSPDISNSSMDAPMRGSHYKSTNVLFRNSSNAFQEAHKNNNEGNHTWNEQQLTQYLTDTYDHSTSLPQNGFISSNGRQLLLPTSLQQQNCSDHLSYSNVLHGLETNLDKQVANSAHQLCVALENQKANARTVNDQIANHLINYTSANALSPSASFYRGTLTPSYLSITQFHYQNLPSESSIPFSPSLPIGCASLPTPTALTQSALLFEPPPRDARSYQNLTQQNNYQLQNAFLSIEMNPCQSDQTCHSRETCFRCVSYDRKLTNSLVPGQKEIYHNKNGVNQFINNVKATHSSNLANIEKILNTATTDLSENKINNECLQSDRTNLKLKLCKNVVNVPKQMENIIHIDCGESPIHDHSYPKPPPSNEEMIINDEAASRKMQQDATSNSHHYDNMNLLQIADEFFSHFSTVTDREFIDVIIEGLNTGEDIATKYQNIPCFKNIKRLCEKTKNIVMTPHCTHRNIHSQGVPWATKDYIFVFTRLTSIWYLLKGYLGQKSEVFNKIEKLYSPRLRTSFDIWEKASIQLSLDILETFIALGNNSRGKWSPKAHSTPVYNSDPGYKSSIPFCLFNSKRIGEEESEEGGVSAQQYHKNGSSESRMFNKPSCIPNTPFIPKNNLNVKDNMKSRILKPPSYINETDSGEEESAKKYIKPGSYTVPELKNVTTILKPRHDIKTTPIGPNQENSIFKTSCGLQKLPMFKSIHVPTDDNIKSLNDQAKSLKYRMKGDSDFVPFKNTPEGKMHSALLKLNSVDIPETPKYPSCDYVHKKYSAVNGRNNNSFSSGDSEDIPYPEAMSPEKIDVSTQFSVDENSTYDSDPLHDPLELNKMEYLQSTSCDRNAKGSEKYSSKSSSIISSPISSSSSDNLNEFEKYSTGPDKNTYKTHKAFVRSKSRNGKPWREYQNNDPKTDQDGNNLRRFMGSAQVKRSNAKLFKCTSTRYGSVCDPMREFPKKEAEPSNIASWYNKYRGTLSRSMTEKFQNIVNALSKMPSSHYFYFEVDVNNIPDYYQIVERPIFIANIQYKLEDCKYKDMFEVVSDIRRVFKNARTFFLVHPNKDLEDITDHFSSIFEKLLIETFPAVNFSSHQD